MMSLLAAWGAELQRCAAMGNALVHGGVRVSPDLRGNED